MNENIIKTAYDNYLNDRMESFMNHFTYHGFVQYIVHNENSEGYKKYIIPLLREEKLKRICDEI